MSILQTIIKNVDNAVLEKTPCSHIYVQDVLPIELYEDILRGLPKIDQYEQFKHPDAMYGDTSTRYRLILDELPATLPQTIRKFWIWTNEILFSNELKYSFAKKFSDDLEKRFEIPWDKVPIQASAFLFRDVENYKINVHSDTQKKIIVGQFYLPKDDSNADIGTSFYRPNSEGSFEKVCTMLFARNSMYSFPINNDSWHAVEKINKEVVRDSLMLIYKLPKQCNIHDNKTR